MIKPVRVVVLSKYFDIYAPFLKSFLLHDMPSRSTCISLVVDGSSPDPIKKWTGNERVWVNKGPEKFSMAGNGNIGLKDVPEDHDILYCGDDIRFRETDTIARLQKIAYDHPNIGILSPKLIGRGSSLQVSPPVDKDVTLVPPIFMWFPCVYIKRALIDKIGYLDESFNEFGSDDVDFCIRAKVAGFELGVTPLVSVEHEASPDGGPTTFVRNIGLEEQRNQEAKSYAKLAEKYKVNQNVMNQVVMSGNVALLAAASIDLPMDRQPTNQEAAAYLKTRSIYVATPAYGGMLTVNYTNSLIALYQMCTNYGIQIRSRFLYNESLINRARNSMTHDFMKSDCTDFFFIDADIGFDPRDIITLLLHPKEEIVGSPCARKSLRLDRIVKAARASDKEFTQDELKKLLGEIVLNFPPTDAPQSFDLGKMLEVQDAGTGLMRIQRTALEKFMKAYPDRWYRPLTGDDEDQDPVYMFFQSCIDYEFVKESGDHLPPYIPEDYAFCREARRAGMKVYIAPWIKTTHAGTYFFEGDLEAVAKAGGTLRT